jgi:hypothetical protein
MGRRPPAPRRPRACLTGITSLTYPVPEPHQPEPSRNPAPLDPTSVASAFHFCPGIIQNHLNTFLKTSTSTSTCQNPSPRYYRNSPSSPISHLSYYFPSSPAPAAIITASRPTTAVDVASCGGFWFESARRRSNNWEGGSWGCVIRGH